MAKQRTTTRVKLRESRVGHVTDEHGRLCGQFSQQAGEIVEMSAADADRYVRAGYAERVEDR